MLTSKERAKLRSMANSLEPIFQIGKEGVQPAIVQSIDQALERRELIKVRILDNSEAEVRASCQLIAESTKSEPVQCIGRCFVLYRESQKHKKIEL